MRKNFESRYNTYIIEGLPAGPICSPGLEAVMAAVNPDNTNYYYFCHKAATDDEEAVPYYATNNYEHIANLEEAGLTDNRENYEDEESSQNEEWY